jgi:hypothetical protein
MKEKNPPSPHQRKMALADHKRIGSKFVPQFLNLTGPWIDVSWTRVLLPELLWIALLHQHLGVKRGSSVAVATARGAARAVLGELIDAKFAPGPKQWFAATSSFSSLSKEQKEVICGALRESDHYNDAVRGLSPFINIYPDFPLSFLFGESPVEPKDGIQRIKRALVSCFDKYTESATFLAATAVLIGFTTNKLRVFEGIALANFSAVEAYPHTEESKIVAASIRSTVVTLLEKSEDPSQWWVRFWDQNIRLEDCTT